MFHAAVRSAGFAARAALKPSPRMAVRALSTTPARFSDAPGPQVYGPGAGVGEVPTDENQATGIERLQVLAEKEGIDLFDFKPLDSSRIGTLADPIKVLSWVCHSSLCVPCSIAAGLCCVPICHIGTPPCHWVHW